MLGIPGLSVDAILSAPLLSYALLPTLTTSWTTSANIVFFSLTWATIVWSYSPLTVEFFSTLAVRILFYLGPCASFLSFDTSMPSVAQSMKAHGPEALPFKAAGAGKSDQTRLPKVVALATFNTVLGVLLQAAIEALLTEVLHLRSGVRMAATLPAPWSLVKDLTVAFVVRGTLSYYIHRFLLHSTRYSPSLTRAHRSYAHSLNTTLPFSAAYDHPICYLLHRWLPVYLPALFFRFHLITYLLFSALIGLEEALVYSGYAVLPSTILLAGMARRQEKHVMSGGMGNFAPYGILDLVHGTAVGDEDVMDDMRKEAKKRDVKGKANKAVDSARDKINGEDEDDGNDDGEDGEDLESSTASRRREPSEGAKRRTKKSKK